jgi:hypothetical protein
MVDETNFTDEHNTFMHSKVNLLFNRISEEGKLPKTTASKTSAGQMDTKLSLAE